MAPSTPEDLDKVLRAMALDPSDPVVRESVESSLVAFHEKVMSARPSVDDDDAWEVVYRLAPFVLGRGIGEDVADKREALKNAEWDGPLFEGSD